MMKMDLKVENVTFDGMAFERVSSHQGKKIQCITDKNIYQVAYVKPGSSVKFEETDIDIDETYPVQPNDIIGLSSFITDVVKTDGDVQIYITNQISSEAGGECVLQTIKDNRISVIDILDGTADGQLTIDSVDGGGAAL